MREDMARVIVERPRIPAFNNRKGRLQALEDLPAHEGMRRPRALRGDRKELNENLTPLRRYLERQVGRPWDKVHSEIAAYLRAASTVQQHVRDHLRDFVAIKARRGIAGWTTSASGLWYQRLYVDPTSGLLCRTDRLPEETARRRHMQNRPSPPVCRVPLAKDRELRAIRGIWYEVCLATIPTPEYREFREIQKRHLKPHDRRSRIVEIEVIVRRLATPAVCDVVTNANVETGPPIDDKAGWKAYRRAQPERRYAVAKRTLSHRELHRHGLSNAANDGV
ncbi:MAG: hypothetical protein EXR07_20345 [Acetobacteraceae bacterium]|nr:hypothetical protein [Acetobacteraceae bacterium]